MVEFFKRYPITYNPNGTVTISEVEIFKLGTHRGFLYDSEWARQALANHKQFESNGYSPSVILGHNREGNEEKPAKGLLKNFQLNGELITADLTGIQPETFEKIRKNEYPHRSVEVNPTGKRFTALALLGGTPPYHKLPAMEFSGEDDCEIIEFEAVDLAMQIARDDKLRTIKDLYWKMMQAINKVMGGVDATDKEKDADVKALLGQGISLIAKEAKNFKEDTDMSQDNNFQAFKDQHGMTPEEAVQQVNKFQEEAKARVKSARELQVKTFADRLKKEHLLSPALVDEVIMPYAGTLLSKDPTQFSEQNGVFDDIEKFTAVVEKLVKGAQENSLFVDLDEHTRHSDAPQRSRESKTFAGHDNVDGDRLDIHEKAKALMQQTPDLKFEDAVDRVLAN